MEIIPAVIPDTREMIAQSASKVASAAPWMQIDVVDGNFAPSVSWPYREDSIEDLEAIRTGAVDLPKVSAIRYEIDLMVENLETEIARWAQTSASRLIFHIEAVRDVDELEHILLHYRMPDRREIGIAVGVDTDVSILESILPEIDVVQCMGIARIGYQGEPYDPRVEKQVRAVRSMNAVIPISVDGGVSVTTAAELVSAGATRLVSGSAVFGAEDPCAAIEQLRAAARLASNS